MSLKEIVHDYLEQPFPLWENDVTNALVQDKWLDLRKYNISNKHEYGTARCINNAAALGTRYPISNNSETEVIYLETPSLDYLKEFYDEHGLYPFTEKELESNNVLSKLKDAITVFDLVPQTNNCISKLVRAIQVLKQDDVEIDVSYSHPKIPFSIFISVCQDNSSLSNLRVAESILHEAMHLKLTLIENVVQLVKPNTSNVYYSPWRDEKRPAQGILHGLFVFKAVYDLYIRIVSLFSKDQEITMFLAYRIEDIRTEINTLIDFPNNPDLLEWGKKLASRLLQYQD